MFFIVVYIYIADCRAYKKYYQSAGVLLLCKPEELVEWRNLFGLIYILIVLMARKAS